MPRFRQELLNNERFNVNTNSIQYKGLRHWWPGNSLFDYIANTKLTANGTAGSTVTDRGQAFLLDGSNSNYFNATFPSVDLLNMGYFTVSAWIKTNTLTGGDNNVRAVITTSSGNNGFRIFLNTNSVGTMTFRLYAGGVRTATGPAITVDTWYNIVGVYDKSATSAEMLKIYYNGVRQGIGSSNGNNISNAGLLDIGVLANPVSSAWSGNIADVRIYSNTVLTPSEIWQLYDPITRYELYQPARKLWFGYVPTVATPPTAPTSLTATAISASQINLSWVDTSADETGFKIQRSTNGITYTVYDTAVADATTYNDVACAGNTRYYYKVCSTNGGGDSAYTSAASAKTAPSAISKHQKFVLITSGQLEQSDGRYYVLSNGAPPPTPVGDEIWLYGNASNDLVVVCPTDKTLVLNETVWDDLPPSPIIGARLGATAPTLATFVTDIEQYTFDATNDYVIGATEITHGWKEGTAIRPHIHWATNGLEATAKGVQWQLKYTIGDGLEAFSGQTVATVDATIPANTPDRTHYVTEFSTTISGTGFKIGAYICWRLCRLATAHANGEPAADPFGLAVGFHVEMDTIGSRTYSTK